MPASFTPQETVVVDCLRRCRVATLAQLQAAADCSHMTVFRGLDKTGHYTSLNENSRWYTLAETPRFDPEGLWRYRQLVFSRHGTLTQTLRVLVDTAPAGYTVSEAQTKVHTPVANLLCRLVQAGQIAARRRERHAVYLAVEATRQEGQWTQRLTGATPPSPLAAPSLPPDWEALPLLRLLVQMIQTPQASAAQLAHTLQHQGLACRPEQVHQVIAFYELKKNGTLAVAELVLRLRQQAQRTLDQAAQLPPTATYRWDPQPAELPVVQTHPRQFTSLQWGSVHAQVVVRRSPAAETRPALARWVPKGGHYAFDLIAQVGVQTFLAARTLAQIQTDLRERTPSLDIPLSSLYELSQRFLFFLGALHAQAAPTLRDYLRQRGPCQWLIDGTLEPGTVEFFGVLEAPEHMLLSCRKIPTENALDVAALLRATAQQFGTPSQVCRDLSHILKSACEQALPGVAQRVCHSHLARDMGSDLYQAPQADLSRRLKTLKLLTQWSSQRHSQAEALREQLRDQGTYSLLNQWLQGQPVPPELWSRSWGRELLLALHAWLLDFAQDGQHQGFPFDPHLLYFHRRLVRVETALSRLWQQPGWACQAPVALANFYQRLQDYRTDPEIVAATTHFEKACAVFESLRQALRLTTTEPNPLHAPYALSEGEQQEMLSTLAQFRAQAQTRSQRNPDQLERGLYLIVSQHLETYWPYLQGMGERTTNAAEAHWNQAKRQRRQTHGRKKLTRDFGALPAEYMLVPNLEIPRYEELVLGLRDNLPDKLAEAARTAGSYAEWRQRQRPARWGRLPQRVLRQPTFLEQVIGVAQQVGQKLLGGGVPPSQDPNLQGN